MEFFKPKDFLKANPKLSFVGGEHFARFLMLFLRFDKLNRVYDQIGDKKGVYFIEELIRILKINFVYDTEELNKRVPATGPVIIVCNHPFGGLESILLIKMLSPIRSDIKIVSTQSLQKIDPISEYFFEENVFQKRREKTGKEQAAAHLAKGGILCLFPSGEVSEFDAARVLSDQQWQYNTLKFIKLQKVPVVPIHFQGNNSRLYYLMGNIHPSLKTMKLPTELLNQHKRPVKIRIGNNISVVEQDKFTDIYQYGRYLRAKTYLLCSKIEVKKFFNYSLKRQQRIEAIAEPVSHEKIIRELHDLGTEFLMFRTKNFTVYCAPSKRIPNVLLENRTSS